MEKSTTITIYETQDYDKFKFPKECKKISLERLTKGYVKVKNNKPMNPIVVNENMEIISGHHRFVVLTSSDMSITYYIEKDYPKQYQYLMQENHDYRWTVQDVFDVYNKDKRKAIVNILHMQNEYNISATQLSNILSLDDGERLEDVKKMIKNGVFEKDRELVVLKMN